MLSGFTLTSSCLREERAGLIRRLVVLCMSVRTLLVVPRLRLGRNVRSPSVRLCYILARNMKLEREASRILWILLMILGLTVLTPTGLLVRSARVLPV